MKLNEAEWSWMKLIGAQLMHIEATIEAQLQSNVI